MQKAERCVQSPPANNSIERTIFGLGGVVVRMVQQSASRKQLSPVQTLEGLMMAKVCTPDHGCVTSQVMVNLRIDTDGTWYVAYWDPDNPMRRAEASGVHPCEVVAVKGMLSAISALPLELTPEFA